MELSQQHVKRAFLCLKSYAYHENLNLFLKKRVAEYEANNDIDKKIENLTKKLNSFLTSKNESILNLDITNIDFHLLSKGIESKESDLSKGLYLTNEKEADVYISTGLNYFINASVEIHIIDFLWALIIGPILEERMPNSLYGNRIHPSNKDFLNNPDLKRNEIFKNYVEQYNNWQDGALKKTTDILNEEKNATILSLDLKSYFYNIDIKFETINQEIEDYYKNNPEIQTLAVKINEILSTIVSKYNNKIQSSLALTHPQNISNNTLPIGFASSSIIGNWYIHEFDNIVLDSIKPNYYGRYVDDIIMVFSDVEVSNKQPINNFFEKHLKGVFETDQLNDDFFNLKSSDKKLPLQKSKLILRYFNHQHSRAGVEVFKKEIEARSSAFKFLPTEHINDDLNNYAYDILYKGSNNKLRSIVGILENETELVKYLASHIFAHRLCRIKNSESVLPQLDSFLKGENVLKFSRVWERIYQYSVITHNYEYITKFFYYVKSEIEKIDSLSNIDSKDSQQIIKQLQNDLKQYNDISLALIIAHLDLTVKKVEKPTSFFVKPKKTLNKLLTQKSTVFDLSVSFRKSNLLRHYLVAWSLTNFINRIDINLLDENDILKNQVEKDELCDNKISLTPRFIHFDEIQAFDLSSSLKSSKINLNENTKKIVSYYSNINFQDAFSNCFQWNEQNHGMSESIVNEFIINNKKLNKIKIAIANLKVDEKDIECALREDKKTNISFERQSKLYDLLNSAKREEVKLLVMPEVSIPVSWLPFMLAFSRRNQIGIIFGLEHWTIDGYVFNILIEALPFKICDKYNATMMLARIKNHYAPQESEIIENCRLKKGNEKLASYYYHSVTWNGVSFASYNCFELADISHRVIFKSKVDMLIACVWNRDTNYYQHILESTVRDIHCYTIHSNTSQFGGSCVLQPTKTATKNILSVKGGDNACILTTVLDIKKLREFQYQNKPTKKDVFKFLPPGYDSDSVLKRGNIK